MVQRRLDEYAEGYKCPVCGRTFKSFRSVNIHISKAHSLTDTPDIYPGEGVEVVRRGGYVELVIKMRRSLWDDIRRSSIEENVPVEVVVFRRLANMLKTPVPAEAGGTSYIY
jgi:hypothetical protein